MGLENTHTLPEGSPFIDDPHANRFSDEELARVKKQEEYLIREYGSLLRPRAKKILHDWLVLAHADIKRKFEYVLDGLKSIQESGGVTRPRSVPREPPSMYRTTSQLAHEEGARAYGNFSAQDMEPEKFCELYAGRILEKSVWHIAALWLTQANHKEKDKFRDAFSSFGTLYTEKKGARSLNQQDFKVQSRKKREALSLAKTQVAQARGVEVKDFDTTKRVPRRPPPHENTRIRNMTQAQMDDILAAKAKAPGGFFGVSTNTATHTWMTTPKETDISSGAIKESANAYAAEGNPLAGITSVPTWSTSYRTGFQKRQTSVTQHKAMRKEDYF
eukprot:TRINITY_DN1481_c0_g1_i1.p1 TRINITY_DN1481_c0_g1~~TRINITY_DN1481_c0_g1_i1.p1  ORF type:complete len:331 (-),score=76.50 TRINITY_DN1481_c0_g1_i1:388-1380(-)